MATTEEYLLELIAQKNLLAAKLASEGIDVNQEATFNGLVDKINALYAAEKEYNPESVKAQSGMAVAEGIDGSVGDINGALSALVEPSEVDPETWMNETVDAAVEEIKSQNETTIAGQITEAVTNLSAGNEAAIKKQVADAVDNLETSVRRSFLSAAKRVTDGNIEFKANTIYVLLRLPEDNKLLAYDPETLQPITLSDRHYCIIAGNENDDVQGAVTATVISYPTLSPEVYIIKDNTLQASIHWTGTAVVSVVENELI